MNSYLQTTVISDEVSQSDIFELINGAGRGLNKYTNSMPYRPDILLCPSAFFFLVCVQMACKQPHGVFLR